MVGLFARWPDDEAELNYDDPGDPDSVPGDEREEEGEDGAGPSGAAASGREDPPEAPSARTRRKLVLEDSDSDVEDCAPARQKARVRLCIMRFGVTHELATRRAL